MIYDISKGYYVRNLEEADLSGRYPLWFQDQDVCRYNSHGTFGKNADWFRGFYNGLNSEDKVVWAICHEDDGHIGNISLQNLSFINRNAEFAVLIGERAHWRKSVGLLAGTALLRHGFSKLNLSRVYCGTAATNRGMQKLAGQLGMVEEGRRRRHLYLEGEWVDVLEYGVLREEFERLHPIPE